MKTNIVYIALFVAAAVLAGCDENEAVPPFKTIGTTTHTMADISVSNDAPAPSEQVTVLISYVNPSSDLLKEITVKAKVGDADYVEIDKFSVPMEQADEISTKAIAYVAPATSGTEVTFDMVITSQRQFPQVKRVTLETE